MVVFQNPTTNRPNTRLALSWCFAPLLGGGVQRSTRSRLLCETTAIIEYLSLNNGSLN
jgi:hypothetical protein